MTTSYMHHLPDDKPHTLTDLKEVLYTVCIIWNMLKLIQHFSLQLSILHRILRFICQTLLSSRPVHLTHCPLDLRLSTVI